MPSNQVTRVTLTIELASGDSHVLTTENPSPSGQNPRFMGQQLDTAVVDLGNRGAEILRAYAPQITAGEPITPSEAFRRFTKAVNAARA